MQGQRRYGQLPHTSVVDFALTTARFEVLDGRRERRPGLLAYRAGGRVVTKALDEIRAAQAGLVDDMTTLAGVLYA